MVPAPDGLALVAGTVVVAAGTVVVAAASEPADWPAAARAAFAWASAACLFSAWA